MHAQKPVPQTTVSVAAAKHSRSRMLLGGLTALLTSTVLAHPGHTHLDGAPGDMHLHALLSESPWGLLLLAVLAGAGVLWVRARMRSARRKAGHGQAEHDQAGQPQPGRPPLGQDKRGL